ncbi:prostaglandin E synthase 2 [Sitophilus oryzae]|uniref:Prostaglandin E synthase 2 n=1 Tax=Sitophilus oryzae TaxID=7048 RepID=A0A6J2YRB9_SITOR|nr:prostaglandin E synthase 2 [Sitophilus oryzae]
MSVYRRILFKFYGNSSLISQNTFKNINHHLCLLPVRSISTSSKPRSLKGFFKLGLTGVTVGALVGTGYTIHHQNKPRGHIINEQTFIEPVKEVPKVEPSRKVIYPNDDSGLKLTLYQYQTCPFCCKVRAFLDYYGISYNVVEVDPVLRQSIKWSEYKKVPILIAQTESGYQPLNDSTMIISALASYLKDSDKSLTEIAKCFPFISFYDEDGSKKNEIMNKYFLMLSNEQIYPDEQISKDERKWRKWVDNVLVHVLSPNVYRTMDESLQAFNWFSEVGEWDKNFPAWERNLIVYVGSSAMYLIGKKLKKKYRLKDDVRESLYDECSKWTKELRKKGTTFHGGDHPNLADLAVYGVLNSIEGCSAFRDLLNRSNIGTWYSAMKDAVSSHRGAKYL